MEQFKDLTIEGPDEQIGAFMGKLLETLPTANWACNDLQRDEKTLFSFARNTNENDDPPPAHLFLCRKPGKLYVSNIIPGNGHGNGQELSESQYNQILDEFADMIPIDMFDNLMLNITSDNAAITDWISDEAAQLLQNFSRFANKFTGASHPLDFERWAKFLIKLHKEHSSLEVNLLSDWLVKELRWPQDKADDLARDYQFARDLLPIYDRESQ